ncbi:MAG: VWA domain-containing protein [Betaproteobacteria bacterium]|nr:VWA domain-containing protein [Betaproteobacteria bacterium]
MLIEFFLKLKEGGVPVSIKEFLTLIEALAKRVAFGSMEEFYYLARTCLVKDEKYFDRYDRAFAAYFKGIVEVEGITVVIPEEWLKRLAEKVLTEEEKKLIGSLGGWDRLMETLKKRLAEQKGRHQGGGKMIGTAGTSPYGAWGYNPEGIRIGQPESRHRRAVKVWDERQYRNFDDTVELGTRNIKVALKRLRRFARTGAPEELDLDDTIRSTARNAGWLDLKMVPERHNAVKVLLFLDVGGSMDDHIRICEQLFSAARSEFKHLEYFYFHNFLYERVWRDNRRRATERMATWQVLHTYPHDYKVILVGDATMSPYEIAYPGGSVEHTNEEAGAVWLQRLLTVYSSAIWLNPQPEPVWDYHESIGITRRIMGDRMFPLTLEGLDRGMRLLSKSH